VAVGCLGRLGALEGGTRKKERKGLPSLRKGKGGRAVGGEIDAGLHLQKEYDGAGKKGVASLTGLRQNFCAALAALVGRRKKVGGVWKRKESHPTLGWRTSNVVPWGGGERSPRVEGKSPGCTSLDSKKRNPDHGEEGPLFTRRPIVDLLLEPEKRIIQASVIVWGKGGDGVMLSVDRRTYLPREERRKRGGSLATEKGASPHPCRRRASQKPQFLAFLEPA